MSKRPAAMKYTEFYQHLSDNWQKYLSKKEADGKRKGQPLCAQCCRSMTYELQKMHLHLQSVQFTTNSLVWKAGMSQWVKADTVKELQGIFANVISFIPTEE